MLSQNAFRLSLQLDAYESQLRHDVSLYMIGYLPDHAVSLWTAHQV